MLLEPGDELMSEDVYADSMGGGLRRVKHNTVPMNAPIPHFRPVDGYVADLKAENERLRWELGLAIEQRQCECGWDEACRFARERDEAKAENERLRYVLSAAIRFGSYAMVLCQDDHVTPEYLGGYRERFRAFEAALSAEYCTRAASMTDSAEAGTSGGLEGGE
jgi:hypothetical protein